MKIQAPSDLKNRELFRGIARDFAIDFPIMDEDALALELSQIAVKYAWMLLAPPEGDPKLTYDSLVKISELAEDLRQAIIKSGPMAKAILPPATGFRSSQFKQHEIPNEYMVFESYEFAWLSKIAQFRPQWADSLKAAYRKRSMAGDYPAMAERQLREMCVELFGPEVPRDHVAKLARRLHEVVAQERLGAKSQKFRDKKRT